MGGRHRSGLIESLAEAALRARRFNVSVHLFNKDPPLIPNPTATNWIQANKNHYDSVGRYYTAGVRFKF